MTTATVTCREAPTRPIHLSDERGGRPRLQPLHGRLLDLAVPVVQHYRCDFHSDAVWLHKWATGPIVFYFGYRDTGTSIGMDLDYVRHSNDKVWRVEIYRDERWGDWFASIDDATVDTVQLPAAP